MSGGLHFTRKQIVRAVVTVVIVGAIFVGVIPKIAVAALGAGPDSELKAQVVAATLVFRALTYFLPIPLGVGTWLFWRRNTSRRKTVAQRAEAAAVPAK